jgi:hypothetical protein
MRMNRPRKKSSRPPDWVNPAGGKLALEQLAPLLAIIYALIEDGLEASRVYFQERKKPIHNVVFATLVRLRVWEEVEARALAAGIECRVVYKANVGVRVIYKGTTIAIWKADKDGKLPACGESEQRQLFYSRPMLGGIDGGHGAAVEAGAPVGPELWCPECPAGRAEGIRKLLEVWTHPLGGDRSAPCENHRGDHRSCFWR